MDRATFVWEILSPPAEAVLEVAELKQRRCRAGDEVFAEYPPAVEGPAVEHQLRELHKVARKKMCAATAVWMSNRIMRPSVLSDPERLGDQPIECVKW